MSEFVGAGIAFPLRAAASGGLALVHGENEVMESVRLVLGTAFGERPMRPDFGCGVHDLVFDPADAAMPARVAYEVRASLVRWEPRIEVLDVEVEFDAQERTTAYISVTWSLSQTNDPRNLVFPFYFLPEE